MSLTLCWVSLFGVVTSIKKRRKKLLYTVQILSLQKINNDNDERIIICCNACLNQNKGANILQTIVICPIQAQRARSRGQPDIGLQDISIPLRIG